MVTRSSTRSTRPRSSTPWPQEQSSSPGASGPRSKRRASMEAAAGVFPRLDDETSRIVLSYLSLACLEDSMLVSKAWKAVSSTDDLWRPLLSAVDPMSALADDRLQKLFRHFSYKQVVSVLSSRLCSCCREPTNGFFVLTCTRVCLSCFQKDPTVKMSSLSFARSNYLLSKSQEIQLPTLRVDDLAMTLTLLSAAKASAVNRWGSYEAFELEMSIRKAKAEASYEPRKQAFHDQAPGAAEDSAGSVPPNGEETSGHHQAADKPRRAPSRPRILGVENETNLVGVNQQERHVIGGEKYGFYTVVNDAYFDRGPTVVITSDNPNSYYSPCERNFPWDGDCEDFENYQGCDGCEECAFQERDIKRVMEESHGQKLANALQMAKHGTTIRITASCCPADDGLIVDKSIRLIGTSYSHLRAWHAPLVIRAPSIVRDLEVVHSPPPSNEDEFDGPMLEGGCETAVTLLDDALIEKCSIGEFGSPGVSLLVHGGRLVAKRNTFFLDEQCGVAVEPLSGKATTVYLEGNTFDGGFRGLQKGPAYCHRTQTNDAFLAANTFRGFQMKERIRE